MMKTIAIAGLAGVLALPVSAQESFSYNTNSAKLADGTAEAALVVAEVVRTPAFVGEKDEQVQAMDQAKQKLDQDYCQNAGSEFVADSGLIIFDKGVGMWMVGGECK